MNVLRPDLPPLPPRIAHLPIDERGYPVPWFVAWVDGKPEFRAADGEKFRRAISGQLCWVCGEKLGTYIAFVLGPMCSITRTTAEPPCHRECAEFSAIACPFLSKPQMRRRDNDLPEGIQEPGGIMIRRNPGVTAVWICRNYDLFRSGGSVLFTVGEPTEVLWFAEGRKATLAEVQESIESGCPILSKVAEEKSSVALADFNRMKFAAKKYQPKE